MSQHILSELRRQVDSLDHLTSDVNAAIEEEKAVVEIKTTADIETLINISNRIFKLQKARGINDRELTVRIARAKMFVDGTNVDDFV